MPLSAMYPDEPITLTADYPFVSSIFDEKTNNPLFISTLVNPKQSKTSFQSEKRMGPTNGNGNSDDNNSSASIMPFWSLILQLILLAMGILLV